MPPKVFLAGTPLREFWETDGPLLFAGPWCASYALRGEWKNLEHRVLPDPWPDLDRFREAGSYCREFSDRLRPQLAKKLNAALGASHGPRYWRILLDPWLTYHVEQMYDHYIHVENAFKLEPNLRTIVLDPASYETPRDTNDFVRMKTEPEFHFQMFSYFAAAKLPDAPNKGLAARPRPEASAPGLKDLAKKVLAGILGPGEVLAGELGMHGDEMRRLVRGSGFKVRPYYAELPEAASPSPVFDAKRQSLASFPSKNEFERLFIAALPLHLPAAYLEGHAAARAYTESRLSSTPKIVFTGTGWHYTDPFKFAAAVCSERGAKLWGVQHGGGYGLMEYSPAEVFERDVTDIFYSWGWNSLTNDPKVKYLPPPMLSRAKTPRPKNDILLVCNAMDMYNIRLVRRSSTPSPADYVEREARFLRAIPANLHPVTAARLPRTDWGWQQGDRLREMVPDIRLDDPSVPFRDRLEAARLMIFDCPETTFLEAMAADMPSIMTWDPLVWPFRAHAQSLIDGLKENGLLFDTPEEAAAEAARIYPDPRAWWEEPKRKAARLAFMHAFARAEPDWLPTWLAEIRAGLQT